MTQGLGNHIQTCTQSKLSEIFVKKKKKLGKPTALQFQVAWLIKSHLRDIGIKRSKEKPSSGVRPQVVQLEVERGVYHETKRLKTTDHHNLTHHHTSI